MEFISTSDTEHDIMNNFCDAVFKLIPIYFKAEDKNSIRVSMQELLLNSLPILNARIISLLIKKEWHEKELEDLLQMTKINIDLIDEIKTEHEIWESNSQ